MGGLEVGSVYARVGADLKDLDTGLNKAHGMVNSWATSVEQKAVGLGKSLASALVTGTAAAGVAAAGVATAGLSAYKDLGSSASDAAAKAVDVNGKSVEEIKAQFDSLREHVMSVSRELGAATVFDPAQVSDAFNEIAGAGYDVSQVGSDQLRPFLDLAASDMKYGLAPATKLVMSTMSQFGLTMEDSARVADVYAKGAAGSAASLSDFEYAMKYLGPVAKETGVSLEEATAWIGKLADKGYQGEMSGTALRTALLRLGAPTKDMVAALEKYGLTVDDINPRTHTFIEILENLKGAGVDVYDFGEVFGKEGAAIISALAGMTGEVRTFTTELENADGAARTMADLKLDSLAGDLEEAKGAASELFITIGEKLAPTARKVLQAFSDLAPKIGKALKSVSFDDLRNAATRAFQVIAGSAGVGLVVIGLAKIAPAASLAGGAFATMAKTAIVQFGLMTEAALSSRLAVISAWAAMAAPVAGLVAGIALITAGLAALGYALNPGKFTEFGSVVSDAFNGIKSVVTDVWALIQAGDFSGVATRLQQAFTDAINYAKALNWRGLGSDVVGMVGDGAKAVVKGVLDLGGWIQDQVKGWISAGGPRRLGQGIADAIGGAIISFLNSDFDIWEDGIKPILGAAYTWASMGWEIAKGIGQGMLDRIYPSIQPVAHDIVEKLATASVEVYNAFSKSWNLVLIEASNLVTGIVGVFSGLGDKLAEQLRPLSESISKLSGAAPIGYMNPNSGERITPEQYAAFSKTLKEYYSKPIYATSGMADPVEVKYQSQPIQGTNNRIIGTTIYDSETGEVQALPANMVGSGTSWSVWQPFQMLADKITGDPSGWLTGGQGFILEEMLAGSQPGYYQMQTAAGPATWVPTKEYSEETVKRVLPWFGEVYNDPSAIGKEIADKLFPAATAINNAGTNVEAGGDQAKTDLTTGSTAVKTDWASMMQQSAGYWQTWDGTINKAANATAAMAAAQQKAATETVQASGYAATALRLGAEVGARFTTDAGNAVRIGLNAAGQQIAVIGQTAQQQFTQAGGMWLSGVTQAAQVQVSAAQQGGTYHVGAINQGATIQIGASTSFASNVNNAGTGLETCGINAKNSITEGGAAAGDSLKSAGESIANIGKNVGAIVGGVLSSCLGGSCVRSSGNISSTYGTYGINIGDANSNGEGECVGTPMHGINPLVYTDPSGNVYLINPMTGGQWTPSQGVGGSVIQGLANWGSSGGSYGGDGGGASVGTGSSGYTSIYGTLTPSYYYQAAKGLIARGPMLAQIAEAGYPEAVVSAKQLREFAGLSEGNGQYLQPIEIKVDGKTLARIVAPIMMGDARRAGARGH